MEINFYRCAHCGNIVYKLVDAGVPVACCGESMALLEAGVIDAAIEKHVPEIKRDGEAVTVRVGAAPHPMEEKHYIQFIAAECGGNLYVRQLSPGDEPALRFKAEGAVYAYEYCNLHGLWKGVS